MHEVPPPITGTFMPTSYQSDQAETQATFGSKSNTSSIPTSETNDFVSCDNSDKSSASETYDFASCVSSPKTNDSLYTVDVKLLPKSDIKDPSLTNGLPSCSFKENVKPLRNLYNFPSVVSKAASVPVGSRNSSASISAGRSIPAASRNGSASIHAGRSILAASRNKPASIYAGTHIPAGRINKPAPFPAGSSIPTGWTNPAAKPFFRPTNLYFDNVHPHVNKNIGIVNSGCSRSMTGNKEKLDDFVQVKGGTVTFGGGDGKITGKATIRTSKLNFENVYYMEELQNFNMFYVSQICDKKNKVLFTNDACLVLSKDFQLHDESQVVLRISRRHDLYTFNLSDIQLEQHINCLLAKTSLKESTKWHRRMADVNFKIINKLAKHRLVEGLPLKLFTNEHNCGVCNKGKQHKASYKAISAVRTIYVPLQLLHIDLFGITSIRSIDHKYYSLVVTDDFRKFEGKANDGFLVGYASHSKAYRVYNLSSKKVEKTLNLGYLEAKPNVQGLGQEWYFDLDYLTDSLCYTRFKTNPYAGTHDTNILAGTQADDLESECDEQVILVPSFPSNSFSGPTVHDVSAPIENNLDYAKELARLQRQAYEAHSAAAKHGFEFSVDTAALLPQAEIEIYRNLVPVAGDPAGSIVPTGGVPASGVPASSVPAGSVPASGVPAGSVPIKSVPAVEFLLVAVIVSAGFGDPAASASVLAVLTTAPAATSTLHPGHSLGSYEHTTRFPSLSDLGNHQPTAGIFSSSSYDDDFYADVTNLASNVAVDPVTTKRVDIINPQSQIIRALQSPVQTRSTVQQSKFGESVFISYVHNQNRTNHADHLHCVFACFLSQLEPSSVAKALEDPDWVVAMGIVVRNKAKLVAQGHNQKEVIGYDEVFAPVARIEAIQLFLAFASYMGFMVYQMDVKSAFLYGEIEEEVYVTQPKGFEDPHNPKHVYRVVKALYGLHQVPRAWYARLSTFLLKHHYRKGTIDKTLFLKKDSRHIILVQVYVDDIIFGSTNKAWCDEFEVLMKGEFEMSAMGELTFFLGLKVKQLLDGIFISQDKYVKDMLKKFDMESVRTVTTPYEVPKHKSKDEPDDAVNVHLFRSMIGSLMYLTASRPDIMFAVSACSRHQCKKQTVVATSSTEAEYVAAANCCGQVFLYILPYFLLIPSCRMNAVSCRLLLYLVSNVSGYPKLQVVQDGPHMPLLASMLVVPAGGDGADAVAASAAAAHDVSPPPVVPPTHSTPGPSPAPQVTPVKEPTQPPSPPPKTEEVGPTTSTRPPSPTRHTFVHKDISEGGGDFVSLPQPNEAPQTPAATAAGGAEDSAVLTALSLKLDRVKRLEGLLQQRKQRLVLSDDATPTEHDIDLASLYTLAYTSLGSGSFDQATGPDAAEVPADTTMPFRSTSTMRRRLRKTFTTFASAHVLENILVGASVHAAATIIPAGSSVAAAVHVVATPSSSIPTAADKGKAPMVDDSLPVDLLTEQERKAQAERVAAPTEHGPGMSDQRCWELDATQLIYTEADWLELLAKIATNSALSKQLLGDDVTKENINERLGMLLLRKRRELAEQSRVKPMTNTQQRDYMRDFVKNNSASVHSTFRPKPTLDAPSAKRANQGAPQVPAASSHVPAGVPAALSFPADVSVHAATSSAHAAGFVPAETVVHTAESHLDNPLTASEHVSTKPTVAAPTPSSSRKRRKHIAKKRVTPIVDMVDAAMIKFDSDSDSDDDPLPYALYAGWEMVSSPLGSVHAYSDMSLDDEDALDFWRYQDSWRIRSWRLYPRAQVHVLETVDGWVIHMFVDVSYPLTVATLERMLKHGLEVPKLLVGGDWTMAEQLIGFIKVFRVGFSTTPQMVFSSPWLTANQELTHHEDHMLLFHDPAIFGVPADLSCLSPYSCWFLVAAIVGCCWFCFVHAVGIKMQSSSLPVKIYQES
nr:retrovirus-related Pol polyprotein from transposon TNT 1-94 [Tanacetum cinerariifolium]